MDGSRFDLLARELAGGRTRRGFLGGLAALAGAAVGVRSGAAACPPGQVSGSGGRCLCKTTGRAPVGGVCPCGAGQTSCNGACVDLGHDPANCGTCGLACAVANGSAMCIGGTCTLASCSPDYANCDGLYETGCESALATDSANCGSCGNVCPSGAAGTTPVCLGGVCGLACAAGYKECQGQCIASERCCTDSDCDDGNACTVDVCGPTTGTCHHFPIDLNCTQCSSNADCGGGPCCSGRCCPSNATCSTAATGEPICCINCDGDVCCDTIQHSGGVGGSSGFTIDAASCATRPAECASCPGICTPLGTCSYKPVEPGTGESPDCDCILGCIAPVGGVA